MLKIIYEDKDVIVLNKPAGLLVHKAKNDNEKTLADELLKHYPKIARVGDDPQTRPGILHRLDKDTSGIMIAAKNQAAFLFLKKQFQKRKIKKTYLSLVHGRVRDKQGIIDLPISMTRKKGLKRQAYDFLDKSKPALTKWRVKQNFKHLTLLEVYPKTGRTHQIRVHLKSIGYPIAGDKLYKFKRQKTPKNLKRQFLHAFKLDIKLRNKTKKTFSAPLAEDLAKVLQNLEK